MPIDGSYHYKFFIVNMNWKSFLYLLCILIAQNLLEAEAKSINDDISEELYSCDYTRFDNQLERLNLQAQVNHERQINQQKELFKKINDLSLQIKAIEIKFLEKQETERQVPVITAPVDDKISVMTEIRKKLKEHDNVLAKILSNQNDKQELSIKFDLEDHVQTMKNTISEQLNALQNVDAKITKIEGNLMTQNISTEIINNQKNIENLLKDIKLKDCTQTLKTTISEKLDLMPKIDEKLSNIDNNLIPKNEQMKFYQDIGQHLNATAIYHRSADPISNSQSYPTYCIDKERLKNNNLYRPEPFLIACRDNGDAWTVIQRRIDGSVDFYRNWLEYKSGFGNLNGEFFIGLEKLHTLTSTLKPVELMIILEDFENVTKIAAYSDFQLGNEAENYKLVTVGSYTGNAGDSFSYHVGFGFSTKDRDNDNFGGNCAKYYNGAWWYNHCFDSNLNGRYQQHPTKFFDDALKNYGIIWNAFHSEKYSLKSVQMLIRPRKQ